MKSTLHDTVVIFNSNCTDVSINAFRGINLTKRGGSCFGGHIEAQVSAITILTELTASGGWGFFSRNRNFPGLSGAFIKQEGTTIYVPDKIYLVSGSGDCQYVTNHFIEEAARHFGAVLTPPAEKPVAITSNEMINIKPSDITVPARSVCVGNFGKHETEEAAGRLIRFFQDKGSWRIFTQVEVEAFYTRNAWKLDNIFYGLLGQVADSINTINPGDTYIVDSGSGLAVTEEFIRKCAEPVAK